MGDTTVDLDLKTMQQVAACGYEPIERKGKGAYGFVYEIGDIHGDLFAFKYILPNENYKNEGFEDLTEIDILTRTHHPNIIHAIRIVTPYSCEIDGVAIILPLAGRTLYDIMLDPRITTDDKLPSLYKLAKALEFLHRSHILHLDIKNTNVVLQGDVPYLIDFGLSMVVDDVVVGKYDPMIRVTIDHRAPEILAGGRIYNAAVDIWAFGIMMLYTLIQRPIYPVPDFYKITDAELYDIVVKTFSNPETLPRLLDGVRDKYRGLCIDLLSRIFQIDPTQRITAHEISDHALFNEFRHPIDGFLIVPPIGYDYAPDHRDILKVMINWAQVIYPKSRAEVLFLAVDLFARISSFYKNREALDRMILAATCLWDAAKIVDQTVPLPSYMTELIKIAPIITVDKADKILDTEIEIIHLLSGILNVSTLYSACSTGDELKFNLYDIILNKDSTIYARLDVPTWVRLMRQHIPIHKYRDKNITITELFS